MRKLLFLLAGLGAALPAATYAEPAPTLQTLLDKHAAAVGPVERIQTRRVKLHISGMGPADLPVVVEASRPNLIRKEVDLQGNVQVTAFDGKNAWKTDPFVPGGDKPAPLPPQEAQALRDEAVFDGVLRHPEAVGAKVTYGGPATVAGRQAHLLSVTLPSGSTASVWLDAATYLEMKRSQPAPVMGKMQMVDIWSSDYRVVQGVKLPYRLESGLSGAKEKVVIVVDAIEVNPRLDRARFEKP